MMPFLKWPGGKRWFIAQYSEFLPPTFNCYIEPFLGGGSVFFHLKPSQSILSDLNSELIATYKAVRDSWADLYEQLVVHQLNHNNEYYYFVRASQPQLLEKKASRMIYLNRTCFNGIYRVNLDGKFNVPKGTKDKIILESDDFKESAKILSNTELLVSDFEPIIDRSQKDDFVFADPPYTVRHNVNGFLKYNERLFSWGDQVRLADTLARARNRGVKIVSTNANHESVRELYRERSFILNTVSRYSSISANPKSRKQFEELVICSV